MRKIAIISCVALLALIFTPLAYADPDFQVGGSIGLILPETVYELQVLGDLSLTSFLTLRTSLELSSFLGVFILPLDEMVILQFGEPLDFYLGAGVGLFIVKSGFGTVTNSSYSALGGIKFLSGSASSFIQFKFRTTGERNTYQLNVGVMF